MNGPEPWESQGLRSATSAMSSKRFMQEQVAPLLFDKTFPSAGTEYRPIASEALFWTKTDSLVAAAVRLDGFKITDWFPRAPGVYWTDQALYARNEVWAEQHDFDPRLGEYYKPESKMGLIENGGIGSIRLRPRRIDGEYCWLATALTKSACHAGIPLAIPDTLLRRSSFKWGDVGNLTGRIRFLQDAGLDDIASTIRGTRPLIVFVDEIFGVRKAGSSDEISITPVVLFGPIEPSTCLSPQYTFVTCSAGQDSKIDSAIEWIGLYANKFHGQIITNFDEQRPVLADAPLSYQRLVKKTYDRQIINRYGGTLVAQRVETLTVEYSTHYHGDVHMGHNVSVGENAIINIDSTLNNVSQTIGTAPGLDVQQKTELDRLVQSLKAQLDAVKSTHTEEVTAIVEAAQKAVVAASKPPAERKRSILQLSADGLVAAAKTVSDIAPAVLNTASLISKFVVGL